MNAELDKIKSGSSAVILCGGKSTRMAQDKAELLIGKKTFLQQIEKNLKDADEILLSVKDRRDYPEIGARHIEDREEDKGPLMGLCSVLEECSYDKVWVMSCDMPLVNWDTAQELEHYLTDGIDAVIPVDRTGKKYVLCAWYRKSTLEILKEQLESGDLKVKHLLGRLRVCYVAVEGLSDGSHKFQNINTREEYQAFTGQSDSISNRESCGKSAGTAVRPDKELHTDIPIVSFVAYSGTGKTTFLERLIPKLKARGLKIAIVKHDGHRFEIDHEGKDSDRFTKAGADVTGLISSEKAVLMENRQTDPEEFLKKIDGVDLILTEGFKQGPWPKIMLHRKGTGKPMPLLPEECLAVISDVEILDCKNVFPLEEIEKTADFLFRYIQNIS
ncbi:molybdopterin-guanine dinucleotide biosynthesis protein B [Dorea longicatena]|mgnify:FL=1|uniref:molybdopterin-guanine dinucleotide biosynthesis protein B n=1 Tax=Dorea longicatena TaxID=88431 RepID=UPI0011C0CAE8|nr:molybdopterin-guanine dinucleotide biosynthesis protein B [Dorea longicatena]